MPADDAAPSSALTSAAHDCIRRSGAFSSSDRISASIAGGTLATTSRGGVGASRRCAAINSTPPRPNGG
jgi:hypothetical protein